MRYLPLSFFAFSLVLQTFIECLLCARPSMCERFLWKRWSVPLGRGLELGQGEQEGERGSRATGVGGARAVEEKARVGALELCSLTVQACAGEQG